MKCLAVYTKDFEVFSDIFEQIITTPFAEDEEKEIQGITVSESGEVPQHYLDKMKLKPKVVVMHEKGKNITILQHGNVFEILLPDAQNVIH